MAITFVQAIGNSIDVSTYANIEEVRSTHVELDIGVDFDRQVFEGKVVHWMTILQENVTDVFMDAEGMTVSQVEFIGVHGGCQIWQDVDFNVTRPNDNLGYAVDVHLPYKVPKDS